MNAQLRFRRAAMALVLVSIAAFSASERNGWVLVVGGLIAVAAGRLTDGPRGRALPQHVKPASTRESRTAATAGASLGRSGGAG